MFDYDNDTTLARGIRYSGERRPSSILDAILDDLQWLSQDLMEAGHEIQSAHQPLVLAMALRALCKADDDFDAEIPVDGDYENFTMEEMTLHYLVEELISILNDHTQIFLRYGWLTSDPEEPGFDELGVWIDWGRIESALEAGSMIRLDDTDELQDEPWRKDLAERGVRYAIYWDDSEASLWETTLGTRIW